MPTQAPLFSLSKLEHEAQAIIVPRRELIAAFARQQLLQRAASTRDDSDGWRAFQDLEATVPEADYRQLAGALGLIGAAQQAYLERLRRTNVLHIPKHNPRKKAPPADDPAVAAILQRMQTIITESRNVTTWRDAFKAQAFFHSDKTAEQTAYAIARLTEGAVRYARKLVRTWLQTDDTALLSASPYPYQNELARLRMWEAELTMQASLTLPHVMCDLRTDVVGVAYVLQFPPLNAHYQSLYCPTRSLYDESLWHQPIQSAYREHYSQRIAPAMYQIILRALRDYRECDEATAARILDSYVRHGMHGLIAWRCQAHHPALNLHTVRERTQRVARTRIAGLPAAAQQTMLSRLDQIQDSLTAAGILLPLHRLVSDLPSSLARRRAQSQQLPDALYAHVARLTGLPVNTSKSLLRNFMVYGLLGLLPIREWQTLIHPTLWSYLHLHKFGRLEHVLHYPQLTETYNAYAHRLGCPSLPQQIVTGLCNHFPKDTYFNSGDGEATAGVPLRKSLKLAGVLRLHEEWLVLAVPVAIDLMDHGNRSLNTDGRALCIFDCGSERAVTCCVYAGQITPRELGLTLYNAIWHPSTMKWPLRGLPEHILLPEALGRQDVSAIREAAYWMHATIQTLSDEAAKKKLSRHPFIKETVAALQRRFEPHRLPGHRRAPRQQMRVQEAQSTIRAWLYQHGFSGDHRIEHAKLPKSIRDQGYSMPGADTVVAGYLLPMVATAVPTVRHGVVYQGYSYLNPNAEIEPGYTVTLRAQQLSTEIPQAVFAAYGNPPCLHYLERADRA